MLVGPTGNAYMNGGPGIVCVQPDGSLREVADGLQWPNGMALVDDGRMPVADLHAEQLVAFEVADDGTLANLRVWADLEQAPDGICADGAVWVASVPGQRCVRVREVDGERAALAAVMDQALRPVRAPCSRRTGQIRCTMAALSRCGVVAADRRQRTWACRFGAHLIRHGCGCTRTPGTGATGESITVSCDRYPPRRRPALLPGRSGPGNESQSQARPAARADG
jgi:hypothetical protein